MVLRVSIVLTVKLESLSKSDEIKCWKDPLFKLLTVSSFLPIKNHLFEFQCCAHCLIAGFERACLDKAFLQQTRAPKTRLRSTKSENSLCPTGTCAKNMFSRSSRSLAVARPF